MGWLITSFCQFWTNTRIVNGQYHLHLEIGLYLCISLVLGILMGPISSLVHSNGVMFEEQSYPSCSLIFIPLPSSYRHYSQISRHWQYRTWQWNTPWVDILILIGSGRIIFHLCGNLGWCCLQGDQDRWLTLWWFLPLPLYKMYIVRSSSISYYYLISPSNCFL